MPDFLPRPDAQLNLWSKAFSNRVMASTATLGIALPVAEELVRRQSDFAEALATTCDPTRRTPSAIVTKEERRREMVRLVREVANQIRANGTVSVEMKINLGLHVSDGHRTPIGPPTTAPDLHVVAVDGRTITIRLLDRDTPHHTAKPRGVQSASIFLCLSETEPGPKSRWSFLTMATRSLTRLHLGPDVPAGARLWLSAAWTNPRGRRGPACAAVKTYVGEGLARPTKGMRFAA